MHSDVAIAGVGEVPTGRFKDRSALDIALTVATNAIADAGMEISDVDAILVAPSFADSWFNTDLAFSRLVDELGLRGKVRMNIQVNAGGTTGDALLKTATGLIATDEATTVLCVHAEKFSGLTAQEGFDFFATAGVEREFEAPYGMTYNAIPALAAQRYMHETGTTIEQIARVAVALRKWAALNPNAMYRDPITVEDVMASREIVTPMRSLMLNALGDGGSAFVVTSGDRARASTETPVYVWGHGDVVNTYAFAQYDDITRMNWAEAGRQAYERAGVGPQDIDIAEIYIAYPILKMLLLEELGFYGRGESGAAAEAGDFDPGGKLPLCTNGGSANYGHTGAGVGVAFLVETCLQLMGKAGERQVPDASIAMKTSAGGSYMNAHVSILGREPRR
jgi:acetyl-CoA C-acetyltransferase